MDGSLQFPVATPPERGETVPIAPGVYWLRMRLPFALNHINLWLLEDGPGWTIVDCGYALDETREAWERIFARWLDDRPVRRVIVTHYHPDHIGLGAWLTERWDAPLWTTEKEYLHARMMAEDSSEASAAARRDFARRAGLDDEASKVFGERQGTIGSVCPPCRRPTTASARARRSRSADASGRS